MARAAGTEGLRKLLARLATELEVNGNDLVIEREKAELLMEEIKPKPSPLQLFYEQIKDCRKCPLAETRTNFVFGTGNENADIMFIGEAPGADEDRLGEPFVGRAGQLLNRMLNEVGLQREEVYIANVLKCRPPGNRDPRPEEVAQCLPYLLKQIELIKPKVLVCLGRIAAQTLLKTLSPLSRLRGQIHQFRGIPMVVTYHPAALLRNMGNYERSISDLRFALRVYHEAVSAESDENDSAQTDD